MIRDRWKLRAPERAILGRGGLRSVLAYPRPFGAPGAWASDTSADHSEVCWRITSLNPPSSFLKAAGVGLEVQPQRHASVRV